MKKGAQLKIFTRGQYKLRVQRKRRRRGWREIEQAQKRHKEEQELTHRYQANVLLLKYITNLFEYYDKPVKKRKEEEKPSLDKLKEESYKLRVKYLKRAFILL